MIRDEMIQVVMERLSENYNRILKAHKLFKFCQLGRYSMYRMDERSEAYANLLSAVTNFTRSISDEELITHTPNTLYWTAIHKDKTHKIIGHVKQVVRHDIQEIIEVNTDKRLYAVFSKQSLVRGTGRGDYNYELVVFKAVCRIRLTNSCFSNMHPTWVSTYDTIGEIVDKTECTLFCDVDGKYYIYNSSDPSRVYFEEVIVPAIYGYHK